MTMLVPSALQLALQVLVMALERTF